MSQRRKQLPRVAKSMPSIVGAPPEYLTADEKLLLTERSNASLALLREREAQKSEISTAKALIMREHADPTKLI